VKMVGRLRRIEDEEGRVMEEFVRLVKEVTGGFDNAAAPAVEEDVMTVLT